MSATKDWVSMDKENKACFCILGERKDSEDAGVSGAVVHGSNKLLVTCLYNVLDTNIDLCKQVYKLCEEVLDQHKIEEEKPAIITSSPSKTVS